MKEYTWKRVVARLSGAILISIMLGLTVIGFNELIEIRYLVYLLLIVIILILLCLIIQWIIDNW